MNDPPTVPPAERWFEDYHVGMVDEFGAVSVTADAVMEFARRYDPQPMHVDPHAASRGAFGGLIASGWHTAAMVMRLFVEHYLSKVATLPSPGIDELRWLKPVFPGDVLSCETELLDKTRSRSKPHMGTGRIRVTAFNQHEEPVMSYVNIFLIAVRNSDAA